MIRWALVGAAGMAAALIGVMIRAQLGPRRQSPVPARPPTLVSMPYRSGEETP